MNYRMNKKDVEITIILEWVHKNVFASNKHDKLQYAALAEIATEELELDVDGGTIAKANGIISHDKNFNLKKYKFS